MAGRPPTPASPPNAPTVAPGLDHRLPTNLLLPPQDVFWDENSRAFLKRLRMTGFDLPLPEESYLAVVLDPDGRCVEATPLRPLNHTSIRRVLEKRWQREKAGPSV